MTLSADPFVHEVLYYGTLEEFLDGVLHFVRGGLRADEPVLVAVPEVRLREVRASLGEAAASVRFLDMAAAGANPHRILPEVLQAFYNEHSGRRVRIVGEPIFVGRRTDEVAAAVRHEALINLAFAGNDLAILCPLDIAEFGGLIPYEERIHPIIVTPRGRRASTSYTDPLTMVSLLNQPLPEPRHRVDSADVVGSDLRDASRLIERVANAATLDAHATANLVAALSEICDAVIGDAAGTVRAWREVYPAGDLPAVVCEVRGPGLVVDPIGGQVLPDPSTGIGRAWLAANRLCHLVQTHSAATGSVTRLIVRADGIARARW